MPTRFLNEKEKRYGQKKVFWSEIFNGFSSIYLGDTIVFLLATYFGASNLILGFISSGIFVAGFATPFLVKLFIGKNQEKTHALCWQLRGLFSLGYIGLLFTKGNVAIAILVLTYSLFCLTRTLGVVFNDLTLKNVSSIQNRGEVLSHVNIAYQGSSLVSKVISSIVTAIERIPSLFGMVGLQMVGVITNIFSSLEYSKIPCRRVIDLEPIALRKMMKENLSKPEIAKPIYIKSISMCLFIINGMIIPFMSNALQLKNEYVLIYSVVAGLGLMTASFLMQTFSDRIGAKPLISISSILLMVVYGIWAILPPSMTFIIFFVLGFFSNLLVNSISILCSKLVTPIIPEDNAIGFNCFINFVIAIFALLLGILSGYAVDLGLFIHQRILIGNSYSLCFIMGFFLIVTMYILVGAVKEKGSFSASDAVHALFSMHGLRAFSMIGRIQKTSDPLRRKMLLMELGTNLTGVATSEIRLKLASPFSADKVEVIRALGDKPRPELVSDLAKIALNDDSYVQLDAIGALGGYKDNPVARDALVALLDCKWAASRSMASKSLSRFSDVQQYLPKINQMSNSARHIDEEIDYLIAKHNIDKEGLFYKEFFTAAQRMHTSMFRQTRYALIASFLRFGSPRLAHLYELNNIGTYKDFLDDFLPEARDLEEIDSNIDKIYQAFEADDKNFIIDFCLDLVLTANVEHNSNFFNLRKGLMVALNMNINDFDMVDMLALLYFGYSLKKVSK